MTDPDTPPEDDLPAFEHPALVAPGVYEFHPHRPKLWILCVALGLASAWLASLALAPPPSGPPDPAFLGLAVALCAFAAWRSGRAAADPRPLLRVDADALDDRAHGQVRWADVESWSERRSLISPAFGWTLKKGKQPPENANGYRIQSLLNRIAGMPGRSYRRKLIAGGVEPIAAAFRALHPELER